MKNKTAVITFLVLLVFIAACSQAKTVNKATPATRTGEAAADALGNDLNNVTSDQNELSADNLSDLNTGLDEVQNI